MTVIEQAKALRTQMDRAAEIISQSGAADSTLMEIADVYPEYGVGNAYSAGDIFKLGTNEDGETQLYRVVQAHTSQADYIPSEVPALYTAIGFTEDGHDIWTQPLGAHDAYRTGDVVSHNGALWRSTVDGNVWEPGVWGWELK